MSTIRVKSLFLGAIVLAATACGPKEESTAEPGQPEVASMSESPKLEQVKDKAPAVLYFVKKDCGSNPGAIPLVQAVYDANKDSGKFFVVMNADADTAAQWSKDNKTTFPIIPDPDKEIIGKYGIQGSQTGIMVDQDLKETKRFAGWGKSALEDLNKTLAGDGTPATVDLSSAPPTGSG